VKQALEWIERAKLLLNEQPEPMISKDSDFFSSGNFQIPNIRE
jgi:radial spoke head protein 4/6